MKYTPFTIALVMLALSVGAAPTQDEPFIPRGHDEPAHTKEQVTFANGTHVTRRLLHELGFTPIQRLQDYDDDPADSLLVVLGKFRVLTELDTKSDGKPGRMDLFLKRGGAVLIASNLPATDREQRVLGRLGNVVVPGITNRITASDKDECYKEHLYCPFVVPESGGVADLFISDKGQMKRVATNQPSGLWRIWNERGRHLWPPPLASYPPNSSPGILKADDGSPWKPLFAVGGELNDGGKLLMLADHGVFINMMMLPRDNDNLPFAMKTFTWLRAGPNGERHQALFIEENGTINDLFEVPLRRLPQPGFPEINPEDLPFLIGQADGILSEKEGNNAFDSHLHELSQRWHQGPEFWGPVAVLSSLVLLCWGSWRLMVSGRSSLERGLPTLNRALEGHTPQVSTLTERQRVLLRNGNLWEPAHALAREAFAQIGLTVAADQAPLPRFVARGNFWERRALLARVRKLWLLAFGPPRRIAAAAWTSLPAEVEDLVALFESGEVQVEGHALASRHKPA